MTKLDICTVLKNSSGRHSDLYLLLGFDLFFPFDSDHPISDHPIVLIINHLITLPLLSGKKKYKQFGDGIDCQWSGVLLFSFLQSILSIKESITDHDGLLKSLISAIHSSFLSNSKKFARLEKDERNERMSSECSTILPQAQQKICLHLGPDQTHRFMHFWAFQFSRGDYNNFSRQSLSSMMGISYKSNLGELLTITCYCPVLSIDNSRSSGTSEGTLHRHLNYHLLHCTFQFRIVVTFVRNCIEVKVEIDNVRCDVSMFDTTYLQKSEYTLPNERHFPAKICFTMGPDPENGCVVQSVSLSQSSQNPTTGIARVKNYEGTSEAPKTVGMKAAVSISTTENVKSWCFEQYVIEGSIAKVDWTLYDILTRKAVFDHSGPPKFSLLGPKIWSIDRYSKACRAFTEKGGVVFANDKYGAPITWRFNRQSKGKTLKWTVTGSIWLTYWPNTHRTRYSETKRHDFSQKFDLKLVQPSESASRKFGFGYVKSKGIPLF